MAVKTEIIAGGDGYSESLLLDEVEILDKDLSIIHLRSKGLPIISSDDIWKKFELPPTPPRSPVQSFGEHTKVCVYTFAERLQETIVSFDCDTSSSDVFLVDQINALSSLHSKLIHDCMWNGRNACDTKVREKKHSHLEDHIYDTPCSSPPPHDYSSTECVDPSAVFPYTLTDSSNAPSDSEEEIDVVTVDKPLLKRTHSDNTVIFDGVGEIPPLKRTRSSPSSLFVESKPKLCTGGKKSKKLERRNTEDADPETRRATHNVLERKRRNDLKSSFLTLRNSVPTLGSQDKTPKVVILRKASDYIKELKMTEISLDEEKGRLRKKQRQLLEKFVRLSKASSKEIQEKLSTINIPFEHDSA